ncbi:MAG TPA: Ig-like domain-containing protein [Gemmatimonadales bacterium]|jgi:hypothetical protein
MFAPVLAFALAFQTPAAAPATAPQPSPVARIVVTPAAPVVAAGDSLALHGEALDSAGRPVPNARVRFYNNGGRSFEGRIDTFNMVHGGSRGLIAVRAVAFIPGYSPSRPQALNVQVLSPPASRLVVTPPVPKALVGQRLRLGAEVYAANGDLRDDQASWRSSNAHVLRVGEDGLITAIAPGSATITATAGAATGSVAVQVVPNNIRRIDITGGEPEAKTGDVLRFRVSARDAAGREVTGYTPSWMIAPGDGLIDQDGAFVANDAGDYTVTASFGNLSSETIVHVKHREVRRPTTTMGRIPIAHLETAEFWPHPNGRNAYLSTIGDRLYALDISDPSNPRITDSVVVDARVINDIQTTTDGKWGVMTREGASSRRNGIVILSMEDPAHPRQVSEFTETVTGGVHSVYIYTQPRYGTDVFLTDDATGSMRVIDLNDPLHPRQIARWQTQSSDYGRTLHDIDIVDGLAYLSYWNDGLVILDIGNGMKGGSPTNPTLVSQFKYNLDDVYRNVEAEGGAGFIRGTHTAWRDRNPAHPYVYVGDEVFTTRPLGITMGPGSQLGKANGRLHIVDVSDINNPKEVAWYEQVDGGTHNVWVAGDSLYLGDYQGGLRILDVGGDMRGDLLAEDREISHVHTGDARGMIPNAAMAWGAFYVNGMVYVNDVFSGLWVVRVDPRENPRQQPAVP